MRPRKLFKIKKITSYKIKKTSCYVNFKSIIIIIIIIIEIVGKRMWHVKLFISKVRKYF
jgi:hypothetical protein